MDILHFEDLGVNAVVLVLGGYQIFIFYFYFFDVNAYLF